MAQGAPHVISSKVPGTELQSTFTESSGFGITSHGFRDADDRVFAEEGDEDL